MQLNKYDLILWVADMIIRSDNSFCKHCMFYSDLHCPNCWDRQKLVNELLKKYNL
jgi:hypothetical protein